jgi:hypothetical protein
MQFVLLAQKLIKQVIVLRSICITYSKHHKREHRAVYAMHVASTCRYYLAYAKVSTEILPENNKVSHIRIVYKDIKRVLYTMELLINDFMIMNFSVQCSSHNCQLRQKLENVQIPLTTAYSGRKLSLFTRASNRDDGASPPSLLQETLKQQLMASA